MSGVYLIYNTETNKRYIGSSINIEERLKLHKRNLKANKHCNQHLQNAWNKYLDYLIFEALEYCEPDQCLKLEQKYIDYYDSANREFGYNIDAQANSAGKHLSEETKLKLSAINKGKKIPTDVIEKIRKANTGKKKPKLSLTMKQKYLEGYTIPTIYDVSIEKQIEWRKHLSEGTKKRYMNYNNRPEGFYLKVIFSDDTKFYPSMREASRQLSIDKASIVYALKKCNGFIKKLNCTFIRITREEFLYNNNEYKYF